MTERDTVVSQRANARAPTVSSSLVRALVLYARACDLPAAPLEQALGAHAASGDPGFALRLGAAARVAHLGLLGVVLQSSTTLGEALAAYARTGAANGLCGNAAGP